MTVPELTNRSRQRAISTKGSIEKLVSKISGQRLWNGLMAVRPGLSGASPCETAPDRVGRTAFCVRIHIEIEKSASASQA
jgi:hypothetical protein